MANVGGARVATTGAVVWKSGAGKTSLSLPFLHRFAVVSIIPSPLSWCGEEGALCAFVQNINLFPTE